MATSASMTAVALVRELGLKCLGPQALLVTATLEVVAVSLWVPVLAETSRGLVALCGVAWSPGHGDAGAWHRAWV